MQILEQKEIFKFVYRIFHIEYLDYVGKVPTESDPDGSYPTMTVVLMPVLFGIQLPKFRMLMELTFTPPVIVQRQTLLGFDLSCYILINFIPIGPVYNHGYLKWKTARRAHAAC